MNSRILFGSFLLAGALALLGYGCDGGREGERCNPNLSHDECDDGLTCVRPSTCVENYCCPSSPSSSSNPYCNGAACPPASTDAAPPAEEAGAGDAGAG